MAQRQKINCRRRRRVRTRRSDPSFGLLQTHRFPGHEPVRTRLVGTNRHEPRARSLGENSGSRRGPIKESERRPGRKSPVQRKRATSRWIHSHCCREEERATKLLRKFFFCFCFWKLYSFLFLVFIHAQKGQDRSHST
jgi:hypothetical protein